MPDSIPLCRGQNDPICTLPRSGRKAWGKVRFSLPVEDGEKRREQEQVLVWETDVQEPSVPAPISPALSFRSSRVMHGVETCSSQHSGRLHARSKV